MDVALIKNNKIQKYTLPKKTENNYWIKYQLESSDRDILINIEGINDVWTINSNSDIKIVNNNQHLNTVSLLENSFCFLEISGESERIILFCTPTFDNTFLQYTVNENVEIIIGKDKNCGIIYSNPLVSNNHAKLVYTQNQWYVQNLDENNKTFVNNKIVKSTAIVLSGDIIFIWGLKIVVMDSIVAINNINNTVICNNNILTKRNPKILPPISEKESEKEIKLYKEENYFLRSPRFKYIIDEIEIPVDSPPQKPSDETLPIIYTIGPMLTMAVTAMVTSFVTINNVLNGEQTLNKAMPSLIISFAMILSMLMWPLLNKSYEKKRKKRKEKERVLKYTKYLDKKIVEINETINIQRNILLNNFLPLEEYQKVILANSDILWQRRMEDDDFLHVRLGIGNAQSKINVKFEEQHFTLDEDDLTSNIDKIVKDAQTLKNVPVVLPLTENNILALLSTHKNSEFVNKFIDGIILQLIAMHSYENLKIVFLTNEENSTRWEYLKSCPHCFSNEKDVRFFGTNNNEIQQISNYLEEIFRNRKYKDDGNEEKSKDQLNYRNFDSYFVIITDDLKVARKAKIFNDILESNDNVGFSIVIKSYNLSNLPDECNTFINVDEKKSGLFENELVKDKQKLFLPNTAEKINMALCCKKISNIPIEFEAQKKSLPQSLSFLEMYNVSKIEQLNILDRWKSNNPTISLQTSIGVHANGESFNLDLHEKFHGPHGLIAGSTGSGKSEFIITYVLSMSVNYHPDEVQFVLIDYKGGGLAGAFENRVTGARLPHLAGTITNLDTSEMNRTLVSINSELKKRQKIFNDVKNITGESTIDIYKYQKFYREGVVKEPISHLFIISDEFAELKAQQPEFMDELITTARIGRSLGVHLILATQKPTGVVNDQIWSNSKFKVCLKVQDRSDSMEMLKRPEAASIKETGRFYLQVGYNEYFDIGQSGWGGAKYIPTDKIIKKVDDSINFINNTGYVIKSINDIIKKEIKEEKGDQLTNVVKHLIDISSKENVKSKKLWLDKIPSEIFITSLKEKYNYKFNPFEIEPIIGEFDNPGEQLQGLLTLNLTKGNTLIYGMPGSGKENLLSTIVYSTVLYHHPSEVNFYILDLGAETLKTFSKMPHVGDICLLDDEEKIINLIVMLDEEMDRRKELFVDYNGNYTTYCKNSGKTEPLIVIVINNYEAFVETYSKIAELITVLYRDGVKYGIVFIITTSTSNTIRTRVSELFVNKLCLQMPNDGDYRNLINSPKGLFPSKIFGRGIVAMENGEYEFQTAYIYKPENINDIIKSTTVKLCQSYKYKARRIPMLPEVVTLNLVINEVNTLSSIPLGYDYNKKEIYPYDFTKNNVNIITTNSINDNINFFSALIREISSVEDVELKVIDVLNLIQTDQSNVKYYLKDFDNVLLQMNQELFVKHTDNKRYVYLFIGIGELKAKLKNTEPIYHHIFKTINALPKTTFIIADNYSSYKTLQTEIWYNTTINKSYGIWLGDQVGTQFAINFSSLTMDERNTSFPDIAFVLNDDKHSMVKKVVYKEEGNDNGK